MAQETESTNKRAELPMRLTRLRVKNFRSIADIDIPLSPLTVLVGPNGSGKSNVVDALRFVRDVFARGLDQAVMDREGMGVIQRWGTEGKGITIGVTVELAEISRQIQNGIIISRDEPSSSIEYTFSFNETVDKKIFVISEAVEILAEATPAMSVSNQSGGINVAYGNVKFEREEDELSKATLKQLLQRPEKLFWSAEDVLFKDEKWIANYKDEEGYSWSRNGIAATRLEEALERPVFYNLNPADLRQPQSVLKESPLDEKGRNLAAVLRHISNGEKSGWNSLIFTLRQIVDGFDTLEVEKVGGYLATKLLYLSNDETPRISYLGQESDGTIRMLGLLAALFQEPSQLFISIEEPEANIHPGALSVLAGILDEASLRSQILVTTLSPDMLDHLPVESFLVVEKVGDTTHVGPLDASQMASVRKRLFTPSELFRMEGLQRQAESAS